MATSQFQFYEYTDEGAPILNGTSGSLVRLLDAILVDGYGNKAPVGWLKPFPNLTGSSTDGQMRGCWKPPSGSQYTLVVNDASPTGSLTGSGASSAAGGPRAAWACGWEVLTDLSASYGGTASLGIGSGSADLTGSGQFPRIGSLGQLSQANERYGVVTWQKSNIIDDTHRPWMMYADAYTFYLFVMHGFNTDTGAWNLYSFGDFYTETPGDKWNGMIGGMLQTSTATNYPVDACDYIWDVGTAGYANIFTPRSSNGVPPAITMTKLGDIARMDPDSSVTYAPHQGFQRLSMGSQNEYRVEPFLLAENSVEYGVRGWLRGLYYITMDSLFGSDGVEFSGSNHYSDKIFRLIKNGPSAGRWAIEISPTVITNDY